MQSNISTSAQPVQLDLESLAWVFLRNENEGHVEVSVAYHGGKFYRRKVNIHRGTGMPWYATAPSVHCLADEWIAVGRYGAPIVGVVP